MCECVSNDIRTNPWRKYVRRNDHKTGSNSLSGRNFSHREFIAPQLDRINKSLSFQVFRLWPCPVPSAISEPFFPECIAWMPHSIFSASVCFVLCRTVSVTVSLQLQFFLCISSHFCWPDQHLTPHWISAYAPHIITVRSHPTRRISTFARPWSRRSSTPKRIRFFISFQSLVDAYKLRVFALLYWHSDSSEVATARPVAATACVPINFGLCEWTLFGDAVANSCMRFTIQWTNYLVFTVATDECFDADRASSVGAWMHSKRFSQARFCLSDCSLRRYTNKDLLLKPPYHSADIELRLHRMVDLRDLTPCDALDHV